jgi:uncharacterized protein
MSSIFNMFGKSPLKPLQEHMVKVTECVRQLIPFFEAVIAKDWQAAEQHQLRIAQLENEADDIKRDVRTHLPKSLFMPVSRSDVLSLVALQDVIANKAKDIAGVVLGRQMQFPAGMMDQFEVFLKRSVDATQQAAQAINELDELQETGFSGQEVRIISKMIQELAAIEHETDELQIKIRAYIFSVEKECDPVDIIFIYKIMEWIGALADKSQNVGDGLQLLLVR